MSSSFSGLKAQYLELQLQIQERMTGILEHVQYIMGSKSKS